MAFLTTLFTTTSLIMALLSSMPNSGAEALSPQMYKLQDSIVQQQSVYTDPYLYNQDHSASLTITCDFHCPSNSFRKPGRSCYDTFDDCECVHGFVKSGHQCVPVPACRNDFHCPSNSVRKPGRSCYDTFDDCECVHGFVKSGHQCVPECRNDFHCPSNSVRTPGRSCYESFEDCECVHGFVKSGHQCVPECRNDFHCPSNSVRKPGRSCYESFEDCECVDGFVKSDYSCVAVFKPEPFVGTFHFRAFADSFQEVPAVHEPHALGYVSAKLEMRKDAPSTLSWIVHFDDLSSEVTVIHFHGPAPKGVNAGIQVAFPQPSHGFASPNKGVAEVSAEQAADIINGLWYINIHTTQNPTGEIRGQLFLTV